ncbi:MAG: hypothetical protein ABSB49_11355 [Polyangia bacterium]|jgi:hypothetical protein
MPSANVEDKINPHRPKVLQELRSAGDVLAARQEMGGQARGNVPPWPGSSDSDFHGTLSAIWVWSAADNLRGEDRFSLNITSAWNFVEATWNDYIPRSLGAQASDEAAYDCAMVLRAWLAGQGHKAIDDETGRLERLAIAARLLGAYVTDLENLGGREFKDPGFLAWTLGDYARAVSDRGLGATARRFVDAAFGMKSPPAFASEVAVRDGLFDFSCTTATRVLAVIGAEGPIPFVGAWLRERVAPTVPQSFVARPMDENTWNCCAAASLGYAFSISTDPAFFDSYMTLMDELGRRAENGALGRMAGHVAETSATFYYAMAATSILGKI